MTDTAVRRLEVSLAGGDEGARLPLASLYLRTGRAAAAIGLLGDRPEGRDLEEAAWRTALATLEPVARVPGLRAYGRLVGWFGGGRYAALGPRLVLFDAQTGACQVPGDDRAGEQAALSELAGFEPVAVGGDALFCQRGPRLVQVAAEPRLRIVERRTFSGLRWEAGLRVAEASPDGRTLRLGYADRAGTRGLCTWPELVLGAGSDLYGAATFDWTGRRVARWGPRGVEVSPLAQWLPRGLRPAVPRPPGEEALHFVPAPPGSLGALVAWPPWLVFDPDLARCRRPVSGGDGTRWLARPMRLSRDGDTLLAFHGRSRGPIRLRLKVVPRSPEPWVGSVERPRHDYTPGWWHPRAEVALTAGLLDRGGPEVRSPEGETVCLFPRDARPLGWAPDGLSLLLARGTLDAGTLELWRARTEAAGGGSAAGGHDQDLAQRGPAFPRERAERATEGDA